MILTKGQAYDSESLQLTGWTDGDGSGHDGYFYGDYFDPNGLYLGADEHGIEPVFGDMPVWSVSTDAVSIKISAMTADEAAKQFAATEKLFGGCETVQAIEARAESCGGWAIVEEYRED